MIWPSFQPLEPLPVLLLYAIPKPVLSMTGVRPPYPTLLSLLRPASVLPLLLFLLCPSSLPRGQPPEPPLSYLTY